MLIQSETTKDVKRTDNRLHIETYLAYSYCIWKNDTQYIVVLYCVQSRISNYIVCVCAGFLIRGINGKTRKGFACQWSQTYGFH